MTLGQNYLLTRHHAKLSNRIQQIIVRLASYVSRNIHTRMLCTASAYTRGALTSLTQHATMLEVYLI